MTVSTPDGVFTFGSDQAQQVPSAGPGSANDATAKAVLGSLYRENGRVWRYVQFDNGAGNVASAAGGAAVWKSLDPPNGVFLVSSDYTDAIGKNLVAGVFGSVVTDQYYTYIQVGGIVSASLDFTNITGDKVANSTAGCKCTYYAGDPIFPYGQRPLTLRQLFTVSLLLRRIIPQPPETCCYRT